MSATISLTQTQIFTALVAALGTFGLVDATGAAIPIIRGQVNRVPEPQNTDFVVIWPLMRERLSTNVDGWIDSIGVGSIASNALTMASVSQGSVLVGATIYGAGVATGCRVLAQLAGTPGGAGTYSTTATADVGSEALYFGTTGAAQATEVTMQADVHGPSSADNAARLATLFRDQYGVAAFQATGVDLTPLYTSDPRQMPFDNGEQQVEERWVVDLCMQANVTITTTQQFTDTLTLTTSAVEAAYPA